MEVKLLGLEAGEGVVELCWSWVMARDRASVLEEAVPVFVFRTFGRSVTVSLNL